MTFLLVLNAALASLGLRLGAVSRSGALAGFLVGSVVAVALGWPGYTLLLLCFALGVLATRIGWTKKRELGIAEPAGGARGARQVLANGGPPALFAILAAAFPAGPAAAAFTGALAAAAADTVSSEIGKWLGGRTRRLSDLAPVAPGTPGAVSVSGTLAGLLAAATCAVVASRIVPVDLAAVAAAAGFVAALLEGLLVPLAARGLLDHDGMNAASVSAGGLLALAAGLLV